MNLVAKVQQWLPTLLSKKLGVAIAVFIAELHTKPHQTARQWALAVLGAAYIAAQAFLDSKAAPDPNDTPGIANLPTGVEPAQPDVPPQA